MLKSPKNTPRGMFLPHIIARELTRGGRYRDFDFEMFTINEPADVNNIFVAGLIIHNAKRLYDLEKYDENAELLARLNLSKLPMHSSGVAGLDLMYYYIVHKPDFNEAARICAEINVKKYMATYQHYVPVMRTLSAYNYFVMGNKERGRAILTNALKMLSHEPSLKGHGGMLMEHDYCSKLMEVYNHDMLSQGEVHSSS